MRLAFLALPLAVVLAAPPAGAFERTGSVVADALLRTLEASGYRDATVGSVTREGGDTILADVAALTAEDGRSLGIGRVVIANGFVNAENALVADSVVYEDTTVDAGGQEVSTVDRIVIDGVRFPGEGGGVGLAALLGSFDTLSVAGVEARTEGGDAVSVEAISAAVEERDLAEAVGGRVAVTGFAFDVSLWEEPLASRLAGLGYDRLSLDLVAAGRWEAATGSAEVRELTISGEDLGALTLTADAAGLTPETFAALEASLDDIAGLLERLQTVSFASLTLAYEDAGLAERLLAEAAQEAGVARAALADQLATAAGGALSALGNPAFAERVTEAARAFLAAPGTIVLAARPQQPVSAAQVVAAAVVRPALLPELLGLSVTADP